MDHFDLRRHFRCGPENEITTAVHLDKGALGEVTTEARDVYRATYLGGKKPSVLFSLGGPANYRKVLDDVAKSAIAASS